MYFTQSIIADDPFMRLRVASCAAQEGCADAGIEPDKWTFEWRRVWSSAPDWDTAWESAQAGGIEDIGKNAAVITDAMILSQVQSMMPFETIESNAPKEEINYPPNAGWGRPIDTPSPGDPINN